VLLLGVLLWRRRDVRGALPLALLAFLGVAVFVAIAAETASSSMEARRFWFVARSALILPSSFIVLWFALVYASLERWLSRPVVGFLVGSVVLHFVLYLPGGADLIWSRVWWDEEVRATLAPLGALFAASAFVAFVLATAILLVLFVRSPAHRAPVALILAGQIATRVVYPLATLKVIELPNVATVLVFDFATLMYVIAVLRLRLFDLVPFARESILARMPDGLLVLDSAGRIADANQAALRLLGRDRSGVLGQPAGEALSGMPNAVQAVARSELCAEASFDSPSGSVVCEISRTPLADWQGNDVGSLILLHDITRLRRVEAQLVEHERALATVAERERLARDLHDGVAQALAYLGLQAGAIRKLASDGKLATVDERLGRLAAVAEDTHSDVRRTIAELANAPTRDDDFVASLRAHLDVSERDHGIATSLAIAPSADHTDVPPGAATHLLRIVDEAVTNAIRHGRARNARVSLEREELFLSLAVEDDGVGFESEPVLADGNGHYGLRFMRERAAEFGGHLAVVSAPGRGTRVTVRIPLDAHIETVAL
jgi:PAS domain S-box-containing protein